LRTLIKNTLFLRVREVISVLSFWVGHIALVLLLKRCASESCRGRNDPPTKSSSHPSCHTTAEQHCCCCIASHGKYTPEVTVASNRSQRHRNSRTDTTSTTATIHKICVQIIWKNLWMTCRAQDYKP
ncbi:unnamed protein product, partial [Laminaria digitata]